MDSNKVGKYITKLRKDKKLTQEQLAEKIGVSNKTISKWENGINIPETYYLFELSKIFGVNIQDILNGERIYNVLDNNSIFVKGVSFYNNVFKRKTTRFFMGIIIIVILAFSILYTVNNFNQNKVYDLFSINNDYSLTGYIITNPDESIFFINDFFYKGEFVGTSLEPSFNNYQLEIVNDVNNSILYSKEDSLESVISLSDFLLSLNISFTLNRSELNLLKVKSFDNLYLRISNFNNKEDNIIIKIGTKKHFANTKIVY